MRRIFLYAALACVAMGAQAQSLKITARVHAQTGTQPPAAASYNVLVSWVAPQPNAGWAGCGAGQPACTFAVWREIHGAGTWTQVATTAANAVSYTDPSVATGLTYDYQVETLQSGLNSAPSGTATVTVPSPPGAPTGVTAAPAAGGSN